MEGTLTKHENPGLENIMVYVIMYVLTTIVWRISHPCSVPDVLGTLAA